MIPIGAEGATSAGGGISTTAGSATITDSVISFNQVNFTGTALGGGIDCEYSVLSLTNCTVNGLLSRVAPGITPWSSHRSGRAR